MNTPPPDSETEVVSGYYDDYKQTQAEIFARESRRVRKTLLTIAILLFATDLLGLAITDQLTGQTIIYALLFPVIFAGLGLLAIMQPMLANILALIVFVGILVLSIVVYGVGMGAIRGIIVKAIIVYLLIAGFQSAKAAETAKKEMQ